MGQLNGFIGFDFQPVVVRGDFGGVGDDEAARPVEVTTDNSRTDHQWDIKQVRHISCDISVQFCKKHAHGFCKHAIKLC